MKNNFGYTSYKVLTVIVLLIVISAILLTSIIRISSVQKFSIMKKSARNFSKYVALSDDADNNVFYLRELVEGDHLEKIRSPFSSGYCDMNESMIEIDGLKKYITLKCDEYIINHAESNADDYEIYKVSKWSTTKKDDNDQKIESYNCEVNGKKIFAEIYDADNFLYYINNKYKKNYQDITEIKDCKVVEQDLYRKLEPLKKG